MLLKIKSKFLKKNYISKKIINLLPILIDSYFIPYFLYSTLVIARIYSMLSIIDFIVFITIITLFIIKYIYIV
jgi:hypothetical protein